ncbi:MAG TPA: glycosyltransferase family 2 protein [Candidatus Elarobacter sp.]
MSGAPAFRVVVPMYNEATGAEACVRRVLAALAPYGERAALIVVDDGSADGTRAILRRLAAEIPSLRYVEREANGGYGAALRSGTERAAQDGAEFALFMDSDLTNDPADIPKFVAAFDAGADVVKATRFRKGGGMRGVPWSRRIFSIAGNVVAAALFRTGVRDCTNGFRAVRVALLMRMRLRERGFPVIVEELWWCKALGARFAEVPVILTSRAGAQRPTAFQYKPEIFRTYLRYALLSARGIRPE